MKTAAIRYLAKKYKIPQTFNMLLQNNFFVNAKLSSGSSILLPEITKPPMDKYSLPEKRLESLSG